MATRLTNVVFDCADPVPLARFWAELLEWAPPDPDDPETFVRSPHAPWEFDLVFEQVPEPKRGQNRVHLDLASDSPAHQLALVERAARLGARPADVGQRGVPWVVLLDPEGNEFCVLEPRRTYAATGAVAAVVTVVPDPRAAAEFWAEAASMPLTSSGDGFAGLRPPDGLPWLEFLRETAPKDGKLRLHVDVRPDDQEATVAALVARGATETARRGTWVVLADPWGDELCVLGAR